MNKTGKRAIILLLAISLLSATIVCFLPYKASNSDNMEEYLDIRINDFVGSSLYGEDSLDISDYANYYIHSIKKSYSKVEKDVDGEPEVLEENFYDDDLRSSNFVASKENEDNGNIKYRDIYLSNDEDFKTRIGYNQSFNPEGIKFNPGHVVIKGSIDKDGLKFYEEHTSTNNKLTKLVSQVLKKSIKLSYSNIIDDNIKSVEFAYSINVDNGLIENDLNKWAEKIDYSAKMTASYVITSIIFLIYAIVSKYDNQKIDSFYNSIIKVPVEIAFILAFLLVVFTLETFSFDSYSLYYNQYEKYLYISDLTLFLTISIIIFCTGLSIFYAVYGIKDLKGDRDKKLVKNSLIYNIFSPLFRKITHTDFKTSTVVITFLAILLIGYFLLGLFRHYTSMLYIAYTILVFIVAGFILKYFEDIKLVREATDKLDKGDFNTKLDENIRFSSIAKNLNSIGDDLDEKVEKAVKSERMKTELITNVSHDLKTPLTSIINYSELINSPDTTDEDIKKYAEIINEKSNQLKVLVENLFEISKVSSNNIELELEDVDLYQLTLQVLGSYEDKYDSKNIETIIKADDIPYIVNIDGNQTSRILNNLFSNIEKYAMENSRVYINFEDLEDKTKLVIKNISKYPLNISEEELMERFIRGDQSRNTEGSGLGLSIAKSLTEIQGGEFYLEIDGDLFKTTIIL